MAVALAELKRVRQLSKTLPINPKPPTPQNPKYLKAKKLETSSREQTGTTKARA
jgi:hypothetical protein